MCVCACVSVFVLVTEVALDMYICALKYVCRYINIYMYVCIHILYICTYYI